MFEYEDRYVDENTFDRILSNKTYRIVDNEIIFSETKKSVSFIEKAKLRANLGVKPFLTLDIETYFEKR